MVRTWGTATPLTGVGGSAQRYWGSAQEQPWDSRPVLIIPWVPKPLLPSQLKELEETAKERNRPHEQHHVFPQAFRSWFARKMINIDKYTIWDSFIQQNAGATQEEIFRYAGQLIYEFELFGPVVPYWRKVPSPPPGY